MAHSSWYGIKPYWSLKEAYMGSGDCVCMLLLGVVILQGSLSAAATNLCMCVVFCIFGHLMSPASVPPYSTCV